MTMRQTLTALADSREAFEKWATEDRKYNLRRIEGCGGYVNPVTNGAWLGWQAALTHQGRVVPVSVLDGLPKYERGLDGDLYRYRSGDHDHDVLIYYSDLRAIIDKGEV